MTRPGWYLCMALWLGLAASATAQIRVNPSGVNVNAQGATTVFLTFGSMRADQSAADALWCGRVISAAPDVGLRCDPGSLFGALPLRYNLARTQPNGALTDIMSIPPSVSRRAYQSAQAGSGENSSFFYVRRFVSTAGAPDEYVVVTCRLAGGGARVPFALMDVRLRIDRDAPILLLRQGETAPQVHAEIAYNGTGRLVGRWEVVLPGEEVPDERDLLTEATLPPDERATQRRYTQLERFNVFLPPTGRAVLPGPDPARVPTTAEGSYLLLLRVEASDDKEGDSNLGAVGAGTGIVHSGAVAGFAMPTLRYVVGSGDGALEPTRGSSRALSLVAPADSAELSGSGAMRFEWRRSVRAALVRVEVENARGESILRALVSPLAVSYRAPPFLTQRAEGGALRWRVTALDERGAVVATSEWRNLRSTPGS